MGNDEKDEIVKAVDSVRSELRMIESRIDQRINTLNASLEAMRETSIAREKRMTDEININRDGLRRALDVAEKARSTADSTRHEANVVFEAIKSHNTLLERRIISFEKTLHDVSEENKVQTSTLSELAAEAEARARRGEETQNLVKTIGEQLSKMIVTENERSTQQRVESALREEREKRQETLWKRLPVIITLAVVITGAISWFISTQSKSNQPHQIYIPPTQGSR